jgi:hypothetical protein
MLRLVQKYNSNHFDAETGTIEEDEDKGLPVKLFPEGDNEVAPEKLMNIGMNKL